jgi:pyridoxine 5-phosphate synthase
MAQEDALSEVIRTIQGSGVGTTLFVNADPEQIEAARRVNADCVEIHTGTYAEAKPLEDRQRELKRVVDAVKMAKERDLGVHAGHGVDYRNVFGLKNIPEIEEFSIGHAVMARAILVGIERAVSEMISLVNE